MFFDFDGLLVNTEHLHFAAYKQLLHKHGAPFPWDFLTFVGIAHQSSEKLRGAITEQCPRLVEMLTWEALYREKQKLYLELIQSGKLELMPDVSKMLRIVEKKKIPHAVVTNSTLEQVKVIQRLLPLLMSIPAWVTREDYDRPKPAPDAYLRAMALFGEPKAPVIGFEDSLRGIAALQKAKITPILICPPEHPQLAHVKPGSLAYFPSFKQLLQSVGL